MYPIIRCPSCNNSLGEYHAAFQTLKNHKYEHELKKIMPEGYEINLEKFAYNQVEANSLVDVDVSDIFEFLKIDRWCCRKILLTVSTFDEQLFTLPNMH
jgi:DNA-directed RNA polymerase subunit N (RpoN/RPB10)